jgi:hypothetical protein
MIGGLLLAAEFRRTGGCTQPILDFISNTLRSTHLRLGFSRLLFNPGEGPADGQKPAAKPTSDAPSLQPAVVSATSSPQQPMPPPAASTSHSAPSSPGCSLPPPAAVAPPIPPPLTLAPNPDQLHPSCHALLSCHYVNVIYSISHDAVFLECCPRVTFSHTPEGFHDGARGRPGALPPSAAGEMGQHCYR